VRLGRGGAAGALLRLHLKRTHVALGRSVCLGLALFVSTQFGAVPRERIQADCES
jgi:hypothetical protein